MSHWEYFLKEAAEYNVIEHAIQQSGSSTAIYGSIDGAKPHLVYCLGAKQKFRLVLAANESRAKQFAEDYSHFDTDVWYYPPKDFLFYSADVHGNLLEEERMNVLRRLLENQGGTIVTTIDGCMDPLLPANKIAASVISVAVGDILEMDSLKNQLVYMGYEFCTQVESPGQFSVRGGIIDIYSLAFSNPIRIEFWDDEVDMIRTFECSSQRSMDSVDSVQIYPATEVVLDEDSLWKGIRALEEEYQECRERLRNQMYTEEAYRLQSSIEPLLDDLKNGIYSNQLDSYVKYFCSDTVSLLDYFPEDTVVFLDEAAQLQEKIRIVEMEFGESMKNRLEKGYILPKQADMLYVKKDIEYRLSAMRCVVLSMLEQKDSLLSVQQKFVLMSRGVSSYQNQVEQLVKDLQKWRKEQYRVVLLCASRSRAERMADNLNYEYGLNAFYSQGEETLPASGQVAVVYGNLARGFEYPMLRMVVITEGDMFGSRRKRKRKKHNYEGKAIQNFTDLMVGDYVVHERHGLGVYQGVEQVEVQSTVRDYLKIQYGDGANLYVPITQIDLVQKYSSSSSVPPKLNKLGGKEWTQTKHKVRGAVQDIAKELVELYAARQAASGYAFSEDNLWQREFEEMFPYEETQDQLEAIDATKKDMESHKTMDRLICGDVGYGKTEIAIRAAFKAVQDSKQVVYLVPTTILAQQHYNTFVQRMAQYPVRIDLLSRFCTPAQTKKTLADLKCGIVDIVIGTHKVLSKNVVYKDLGLLIIDEEQRFGVTHKEKIKKLKNNVDVLTLTATPIPRTLHMSLIGIRDMSVLEEPPLDRVPIQTYVMEHDEEMIREAIYRELARQGQVYYVYNRVQNIEEITGRISQLVPEATVEYAHGQMGERNLEKIMMDFINGEIDVLVSTTIIETGLDIPNVNTIIIQDADKFGLSQLYQLRGRVGRANRTAYAFLTYTRGKLLKEVAEKRLAAIRQFTELGSGIKIAMRDLEIRGAGNLLGAQQHGHMEAVGYDLYCKMLNQAVRSLRNPEILQESYDTLIDMTLDAYIPRKYITDETQKLDMYKKIALITDNKEYEDIQDELIDRYGEPPRAVQYLMKIALLKASAHQLYITELTAKPQKIVLTMYAKAPARTENIAGLLGRYRGRLRMQVQESPQLIYSTTSDKTMDGDEMFEVCYKLLQDLKEEVF